MTSSNSPIERTSISRRSFLYSAGLGGASLAFVAACGDNTTDEPGANPTVAGSAATAALAGTTSMYGAALIDSSPAAEGWKELKETFEAAGDIMVEYDGAPTGDFVTAVTTRARSGNLGDILLMYPGLTHEPLFEVIAPVEVGDYPELDSALTSWDATALNPDSDALTFAGVPNGGQGTLFYYNREHFEQAGLDPSKAPQTWDEFAQACDALKLAGFAPLAMTGFDNFSTWWFWGAFSPQYITSEESLAVRSGDLSVSTDAVLASLSPLKESFDRGWWPDNYSALGFPDAEGGFIRGEFSMIPSPISGIANWKVWDDQMGKDAYGVFTAPSREDRIHERAQFFSADTSFGMNADAAEPELAKEFIRFMSSISGQEIRLKVGGAFPNRLDIDVGAVSGSDGAKEILEIVKDVGTAEPLQTSLGAGAFGVALAELTTSIAGDNLPSFLESLQAEQELL